MTKLHELAHRVDSKETFLEFVAALRSDWEMRNRESEWENPDLGRFLDAMRAWTEDMDKKVPASPSWRAFADMLMAAKSYE